MEFTVILPADVQRGDEITVRGVDFNSRVTFVAFHPGTPGAAPTADTPVAAGAGCDPIHDSMTLAYRLLVPLSRTIGDVDPGTEAAASTAVARGDNPACRYAPGNLRTYLSGAVSHVDKV